jgi:hypothetical protein
MEMLSSLFSKIGAAITGIITMFVLSHSATTTYVARRVPPPVQITATSSPVVSQSNQPVVSSPIAPVSKPKPVVKKKYAPQSTATTTPTVASLLPLNDLNNKTRETVMNIMCTAKNSGSFTPISGSGVIIDPRGVILTNAHMAQYFLLKDYSEPDFLDCVIRTGSPARLAYMAKLLYISPRWIDANSKDITEQTPYGTGEHDFALLYIYGSAIKGEELPASFPFTEPDLFFNKAYINERMLLVSYPAELIGGISTQMNLGLVSSESAIQKAFYFNEKDADKLDIFSLGGVIVAQGGSSGGAVVDETDGKLAGIIVTSTPGKTTAEKDLRAISLSHVNRSMIEETGKSLTDYLNTNLDTLAGQFSSTTFPTLKQKLTDAIEK